MNKNIKKLIKGNILTMIAYFIMLIAMYYIGFMVGKEEYSPGEDKLKIQYIYKFRNDSLIRIDTLYLQENTIQIVVR